MSSSIQHKSFESPPHSEGGEVWKFDWVDADRATGEWRESAEQLISIRMSDEHVRDASNPRHPPFFDGSGTANVLVFPILSQGESETGFNYESDCAIFTSDALVTVRDQKHISHEELVGRLQREGGQKSRSATELLLRILTIRADEFLSTLDPLQSHLDSYRNRILDPTDRVSDWPDMYRRRTFCRQMRNLLRQEEGALIAWGEAAAEEFSVRASIRYSNLLEHVRRAINELREIESEVDSLVDLHFTATAHQTNEIMRVLTVLSAIFLPLTFVVGVFGMNFEFMPELKFRLGYPLALVGMAVIAFSLFLFFKKKKWV